MKKRNIINLIKYHAEKNEIAFRNEAHEIAKEMDRTGDEQLADYIMTLIAESNTFVPQQFDSATLDDSASKFFEEMPDQTDMLLLPSAIVQDLLGIVNAVKHRIGVNKFMLKGDPGSGKTEAVKQLAHILGRKIYMVNTAMLVDSKLGQTQKNIAELFREIGNFVQPEKALVLFDELDAIALDRTNSNDIREMGRATTAMLRGLDGLNPNVVLVATTNIYKYFDKALRRRFDFTVDFNRYSKEDLLRMAEKMLDRYLDKVKLANRDVRLFRKILNLVDPLPYPGDLQNFIKTSVAFSDPENGLDYMHRLYVTICNGKEHDIKELQGKGFTVREIGIMVGKSKSGVARELQEAVNDGK